MNPETAADSLGCLPLSVWIEGYCASECLLSVGWNLLSVLEPSQYLCSCCEV